MKQESFDSLELFKEYESKLAGVFLIIMGGIFFLGMSGVTILGLSPWMFMALLPLYWIGAVAYRRYRKDGRVSRRVLSILIWAVLPFAYMGAAFFGIDVSKLWPLGIVAVGISILLSGSDR